MGPKKISEGERRRRRAMSMRAYRARKSEDPEWLAKEAERVRVSMTDCPCLYVFL
jgi:hypothetical protein